MRSLTLLFILLVAHANSFRLRHAEKLVIPCDEQGKKWHALFSSKLKNKISVVKDCNEERNKNDVDDGDTATVNIFQSAKDGGGGGGSGGTVSPFGLGLGKTLLDAFQSGNSGTSSSTDELQTEDVIYQYNL
jgi:hypothetical protein